MAGLFRAEHVHVERLDTRFSLVYAMLCLFCHSTYICRVGLGSVGVAPLATSVGSCRSLPDFAPMIDTEGVENTERIIHREHKDTENLCVSVALRG